MDKLLGCPFCGGKEIHSYWGNNRIWFECESCGVKSQTFSSPAVFENREYSKSKLLNAWNTRAVPDVPELVRYSGADIAWGFGSKAGIKSDANGEYVLHSQATVIIAAKDAEIERLRSLNHYAALEAQAIKRAEAAEAKNIELEAAWLNAEGKISDFEAKLAQNEKQEPVGSVAELGIAGSRIKVAHNLNKDLEVGTPLYTAPIASDAELRAERDQYKQALTEISEEFDLTTNRIRLRNIARAALNPPEART